MRAEKYIPIERARNGFSALASTATDETHIRFYGAMADLARAIDTLLQITKKYPDEADMRAALHEFRRTASMQWYNKKAEQKLLASPKLTDAEKVKIMEILENED